MKMKTKFCTNCGTHKSGEGNATAPVSASAPAKVHHKSHSTTVAAPEKATQ
jgi:hypothetical protein